MDRLRVAAAGAVTTLLLFGVLGALTVDRDYPAQQVTTAAPPTTAPVDDTPTTTTTTAAPATTTAAPAPAPAPDPAQAKPRTTVAPAPAKAKSGSYPGSISFGYQAGRTSWSGTSNGIDMAMSIDKANPKTGESVNFTFTFAATSHSCCMYGISFGDGGPVSSESLECSNVGPHTRTFTATRSYNKAGRWQFTLTARTSDCIHDPGAQPLNGYLYGWIEVVPGGTTTSQGPSLPTFRNGVTRYGPTQYDNDPSYVTVAAQVSDADGYVAKLVVDYGDGATATYPEQGWGCRQTASGWPEGSFLQTPNNPPPTHQYATPGTYTVTVTAYSQGCDGRDVQTASASFQHVY